MATAASSYDFVRTEYKGLQFDVFRFPGCRMVVLPLMPEWVSILTETWTEGEERETVLEKLLAKKAIIDRCRHRWKKRAQELTGTGWVDECGKCTVSRKTTGQD